MCRREKLIKLFNRQKGLCIFCGCQTWLSVPEVKKQKPPKGLKMKDMATADHIIPQSLGGTDKLSNLAMACSLCNNDRQTTPFEEFMEVRQDPVKWKHRNKALTAEYQKRSAKRQKDSAMRANALVWKLAVLFYFYPGLYEVAKTLPNQQRGRR